MADAVTSRYIYPPNWEGHRFGEGDLRGIAGNQGGGARRYILHLTNISDGTGESLVEKVDISKLPIAGGLMGPTVRTVIEWIEYDVYGMDVTLYWRRSTDMVIARLPGGASPQSGKIRGPMTDPGTGDGTDETGNILLSTSNAASGDSYDIRMCIRPKDTVRPGRNPDETSKIYTRRVVDGELGDVIS